MNKQHKSKNESGNIFFYILLAIALFAALSAVVSRGNRGTTSTLTDQQAKLAAQEIIEYGQAVSNAVQKLRLRGCTDTQISFENGVVSGYINPNAPNDNSCHVFDINGGGLNWANLPAPFSETGPDFYDGQYNFITGSEWAGNGNTCANADCVDLIMLGSFLNEAVCNKINETLGYNSDIQDSDLGGGQFKGTYLYNNTIANEGTGTDAANQSSACYFRALDNTYIFAQLLIAR